MRQVLVEHALVTVAGGALGALAGVWARRLLEIAISPAPGPFRFDLDAPGGALLALVVLAAAFLFGALSAWSGHAAGLRDATRPAVRGAMAECPTAPAFAPAWRSSRWRPPCSCSSAPA